MMNRNREVLMYELVEALRLLGKVKWFLGDTNLTLEGFLVLDLISESGTCNMKDIVDGFSLPASTATGIVDRLVEKRYVKRGQSNTDRRKVTLEITGSGRQVYDRSRSEALAQMAESLSHLSKKEIETLVNLVRKLTSKISRPKE